MHTISKTIEIDAGHRVPLHASKCRNLHGHRYSVSLTVAGNLVQEGSETGMVKDFSFLKEVLTSIVHDPCDHTLILSVDDIMLHTIGISSPMPVRLEDVKAEVTKKQDCFTLYGLEGTRIYVVKDVPTAENLAQHWGMRIIPHLPEGVQLVSLDVWETPTSLATWSPA